MRGLATLFSLVVALAGPIPLWLHQATCHTGAACFHDLSADAATHARQGDNQASFAQTSLPQNGHLQHGHSECCHASSAVVDDLAALEHLANVTERDSGVPSPEADECGICFALQQCMVREIEIAIPSVRLGPESILTADVPAAYQEPVSQLFLRGPPRV